MFQYVCFYKGRQITVDALRTLEARDKAAKLFKAKKPWEVHVVLAGKDGVPIPISTASLG